MDRKINSTSFFGRDRSSFVNQCSWRDDTPINPLMFVKELILLQHVLGDYVVKMREFRLIGLDGNKDIFSLYWILVRNKMSKFGGVRMEICRHVISLFLLFISMRIGEFFELMHGKCHLLEKVLKNSDSHLRSLVEI